MHFPTRLRIQFLFFRWMLSKVTDHTLYCCLTIIYGWELDKDSFQEYFFFLRKWTLQTSPKFEHADCIFWTINSYTTRTSTPQSYFVLFFHFCTHFQLIICFYSLEQLKPGKYSQGFHSFILRTLFYFFRCLNLIWC